MKQKMTISFSSNEAVTGGAIHANNKSSVAFTENSITNFYGNDAKMGGAIYSTASFVSFSEQSSVEFDNNTVWQDGGAMYFDDHFYVILAVIQILYLATMLLVIMVVLFTVRFLKVK